MQLMEICRTTSLLPCFNTASGKSLHAALCPGSRGNTGLKMGFWKTYGLFAVFWKIFSWTLFHFVKKLCFYSLPHKALKCPQTFWKSNALFITVSILLFALFCQMFLAHRRSRVRLTRGRLCCRMSHARRWCGARPEPRRMDSKE